MSNSNDEKYNDISDFSKHSKAGAYMNADNFRYWLKGV
jgi:hypothetical protein